MISYDAWMGVNIDELISTNLPLLQEPPTSNPLVETEYKELLCAKRNICAVTKFSSHREIFTAFMY